MATTNDITGDAIRSKKPSKDYENNFDVIFRKPPVAHPDTPTDKSVVTPSDWDEDRMDIIGQNGNDGDSYVTEQSSLVQEPMIIKTDIGMTKRISPFVEANKIISEQSAKLDKVYEQFKNALNTKKPTRLEVIDADGRTYTNWKVKEMQFSYQDDGKTLKIFIKESE